jgi:predicted permease
VDAFEHELRRRLEQLPGVSSVGLTSFLPGSGADGNQAFVAEGYVTPKDAGMNLATPIQVEGNYFETIGTPLRRGRLFTEADKPGGQLVVIVNQKLAEKYWPGQDPIGKRVRVGTADMKTPWLTIVGEVADMKQGSPDDATKYQFYQPVEQLEEQIGMLASPSDLNGNNGYIVLRTQLAPEQMENALRATVRSMDPQLPLDQVQTMEQAVSTSEAPRRFNTVLITAFAAAAVLLAILGIYSVIAFSVALRVQEMAIRIALGSQRTGILRLVVVSGAKLAAIGCGIGLVGAIAASKLLGTFLFGVSPFDPLVLSLSAVAILLLALAASVLPARRAAYTDPVKVLRAQ